jgi:anti-sigma factor RsiW
MIDKWTDRLSEYLDGDLDPRDEALLEAHLIECATCRATLAELRAVVARAGALTFAEPPTDLWAGIRQRIEEEVTPGVAPLASVRGGRRRFTFSLPQLAAAGLVLALASGGSVWLTLRSGGGSEVGSDAPIAAAEPPTSSVPSMIHLIENADDYEATITQLEQALAENRQALDPVTIAIVESNLKIIDAAITEAIGALRRDPGNTYLRQHLGNTVEKKIEVLRRAAGIGRAQT